MARRTRLLALAGAAAVLAGTGLLGWSFGSGGSSAGPGADVPRSMDPASGPASSSPTSSATSGGTGSSDDPPASEPGSASSSASQPAGDVPTDATSGPATSGAPQHDGIEVLPSPSTAASGGNPYLPGLPSASPPAPLLTQVPQSARARGALADGFPAELAPPEGSTIESSSVAVDGRHVQAALVAEPAGGAKALLLHYRTVLGQRGFQEVPTQAPENAPAASFQQGDDTVTITLQNGVCYLLANLRAAA